MTVEPSWLSTHFMRRLASCATGDYDVRRTTYVKPLLHHGRRDSIVDRPTSRWRNGFSCDRVNCSTAIPGDIATSLSAVGVICSRFLGHPAANNRACNTGSDSFLRSIFILIIRRAHWHFEAFCTLRILLLYIKRWSESFTVLSISVSECVTWRLYIHNVK